MHEEHLGEGYHEKVRKKIRVDEALLPDSIIDAETNIGAMKSLISPVLKRLMIAGRPINSAKKYALLQAAALNYLCGVLCLALKSRTSAPPYDKEEYQRNWNKKREKFMRYANMTMMELMEMG